MRLRFGEYLFDSELRTLQRSGQDVHLTPKAFHLLELLLERRPRPVAKTELLERLWPGLFIGEGSLTNLVAELRSALGDRPRQPSFLKTLHRYGYGFCGEITAASEPPLLELPSHRLVTPDREVSLAEGENVVGRDGSCLLWLASPTVSRRHARIVLEAGEAKVEDLGSKNGTYLNGHRISEPTPLKSGDVIQVGEVRLGYRVLTLASHTESLPIEMLSVLKAPPPGPGERRPSSADTPRATRRASRRRSAPRNLGKT